MQRQRERGVCVACPSTAEVHVHRKLTSNGHRYDNGPWTSVLDVHTRPSPLFLPYPALSLVAKLCCAAPEQMGTAGIEEETWTRCGAAWMARERGKAKKAFRTGGTAGRR